MTTLLSKRRRQFLVALTSQNSPQPQPSPEQPSAPAPPPATKPPRCAFTASDGRRCNMLPSGNGELCAHHAARLEAQDGISGPANQAQAAEILGPLRDFRTNAAINHALGRVFTLLADNRLDTRKAAVLGYLCQLMQQSVKNVQREAWGLDDPPELQNVLKAIDKAPPSDLRYPPKQ